MATFEERFQTERRPSGNPQSSRQRRADIRASGRAIKQAQSERLNQELQARLIDSDGTDPAEVFGAGAEDARGFIELMRRHRMPGSTELKCGYKKEKRGRFIPVDATVPKYTRGYEIGYQYEGMPKFQPGPINPVSIGNPLKMTPVYLCEDARLRAYHPLVALYTELVDFDPAHFAIGKFIQRDWNPDPDGSRNPHRPVAEVGELLIDIADTHIPVPLE